MLRVMIVDESTQRAAALAEALRSAGCDVVVQLSTCENLQTRVLEMQPDAPKSRVFRRNSITRY